MGVKQVIESAIDNHNAGRYCKDCLLPGEVSALRKESVTSSRAIALSIIEMRELAAHIHKLVDLFSAQMSAMSQQHMQEIDALACQTRVLGEIVLRLERNQTTNKG